MQINRRRFLTETTALASAAGLSAPAGTARAAASPGFANLRNDFHLREGQTYLNSARHYPLNVHSVQAMQAYIDHPPIGFPSCAITPGTAIPGLLKNFFAKSLNAGLSSHIKSRKLSPSSKRPDVR